MVVRYALALLPCLVAACNSRDIDTALNTLTNTPSQASSEYITKLADIPVAVIASSVEPVVASSSEPPPVVSSEQPECPPWEGELRLWFCYEGKIVHY